MPTCKGMQQPGSPRQPLCTTGRDCGCATFSNRLRWVLGSALIASSLACVLTMLVMDTDCNVECERVVEQRFGEEIDITDADECQPNSTNSQLLATWCCRYVFWPPKCMHLMLAHARSAASLLIGTLCSHGSI